MSSYAYDVIFIIVVLEVIFAFSIGLICIVLSFNLFVALKDSSLRVNDHRRATLPVGDFPVVDSHSSRRFTTCVPDESDRDYVSEWSATEPLLRRDHDSYGSDEADDALNTTAIIPPFYPTTSNSSANTPFPETSRVEASPNAKEDNSFTSVLKSFFQYVL